MKEIIIRETISGTYDHINIDKGSIYYLKSLSYNIDSSIEDHKGLKISIIEGNDISNRNLEKIFSINTGLFSKEIYIDKKIKNPFFIRLQTLSGGSVDLKVALKYQILQE